ncbi:MAG: MFS transporter [Desulfohalobiaceae bacterium]
MRIVNLLYLLHFFRHGMVLPLIPLFARELGASAALIGAVVSAFSLLALFLAIPAGRLADRLGSRFILALGVCSNMLYSILLLLANNVWILAWAQLLGGLGFLFMVVGSQAYVTRLGVTRQIERGFAGLSITAAVGQGLGPFCGGLLVSAAGYAGVFALALLLSLSGCIVLALPRQAAGPEEQSQRPKLREQLGSFLADRIMLGVLLFTFAAVFTVTLRSSFLPVLLQDKGFGPGYIGFFISSFAVAMTLVRLVSARLLRTFKRGQLLLLALTLLALGVLVLPVLQAKPWLTLALLVCGLGFGISQPLSMVMVSDLATTSESGLAMGLRFTVITSATFLGPLLLGMVVSWLGLEWAFYLPAGLLLAVGGLLWSGHRRLRLQDVVERAG